MAEAEADKGCLLAPVLAASFSAAQHSASIASVPESTRREVIAQAYMDR